MSEQRIYPAHISDDGAVQTVEEHCGNTANAAAGFLESAGLSNTAYMAGILHDCGKYSEEFKTYINAAHRGAPAARGSVIHSFAGMGKMLDRYHSADADGIGIKDVAAEIIAYAIGAHHGLFDVFDRKSDKSNFTERRTQQKDYDNAAQKLFSSLCAADSELDKLFDKAEGEISQNIGILSELSGDGIDDFQFYLGALARLVLSALADADRLDTASFMSGHDQTEYGIKADYALWERCSGNLLEHINSFGTDREIDKARRALSDACANAADAEGGIYRLNLPTGAGKTLSGLRFAVEHAKKRGKERIILVSPLLSILDQNAKVVHRALGNDEIILEHHSDVINEFKSEDERRKHDYLVQTWNAPVIITTLVQLLDTFFKGKMSCIRRFHALCGSVIIIDEVQTVPAKMLSMFNLTLNFLAKVCGATVILCSATQPELTKAAHPVVSVSDLLPKVVTDGFADVFRRNRIIDRGNMSLDELGGFVKELSEDYDSILVVCNKKTESEKLFGLISGDEDMKDCSLSHLSASMCMEHRVKELERLKADLEGRKKAICVSTQVIEAGVDISFSAVIRLTAGIDSIVQAAGRCNRSGTLKSDSPVYVVTLLGEDLSRLEDIKQAKDSSLNLLYNYRADPERFCGSLDSEAAVSAYYRSLYEMTKGKQDYPVKNGAPLFSLLSFNESCCNEENKDCGRYGLTQAFKTAGEQFEVFDTSQRTVIVPYGEGEAIIAELLSSAAENDREHLTKLINKARKYSVSLFEYQYQALVKERAITSWYDGLIYILDGSYYSKKTGLSMQPAEEEDSLCSTLMS